MSRRRRQGLSPSLFPFLAVLVCTLGTLILLLALVAENATTAAANESQQQERNTAAEPPTDQLTAASVHSLIEETEFRVEQLIAFRDAQLADIEDRRDQIAHLDDHMRRIRAELKQLNDEVEMATGRQQVSSVDQQQLADLKSQIETESKRVAELREQLDNQTPRVVIVPHKGPNGTDRRPVYLECTADGLKIWPEGVRLTETYLQDSVADANPLDAALRVIRHHAMQNYGDTIAPYPLLVVRPDGIQTYAAARLAMRDWDDQFGYELVPADVKLAYDTPDPALKEKLDYAIRQAIIKQNAMQRLAARISGRGGLPQASGRYPTLSAASMDRQGRASGFRDHRDGYTHGNSFAQAGNTGAGTGVDAASKLEQQLRDARGELPQGVFSGDPLGSGYAGNVTQQGTLAGDSTGDSASGFPRDSVGDSLGAAGGPREPTDTWLSQRTGSSGSDGSPTATRYADLPRGDGQQREAGNTGSSDSNPVSNHLTDQRGDENTQTNPYLTDTSPGQQDFASNPSAPSSNQNAATNPSGQASAPQSPASSSPASSSPASGSPASGSSAAAPTRGAIAGLTMPSTSTPPSMELNPSSPSTPSNSSELVRRQGNNWALPKSVAASSGNAIVRTIHVQCYPDRFVLLPPRGAGRIEMFGLSDGDINRATLELATAIRDRIVRWGAALPGGRWQPRLDVEIMPRGDRRFHQLRMLMSGSGVEVEGRPSR